MKNYYIASGLENAAQVRELKAVLDAAGWKHTYDWTVHGAISKEPGVDEGRFAQVAQNEAEGVWMADVVIVLLPGGRGTHTELGIAIGMVDPVVWAPNDTPTRIVIYSPDPERDFGTNRTTCVFYHHPCVEKFDDMTKMIDSLLGTN